MTLSAIVDRALQSVRGSNAETAVLKSFRLRSQPRLFAVGMFDAGITVLRQQVRALNLAWALVETGELSTTGETKRIAIVGAGFAGLTFAAALLLKRVNCEITLFEEHDALLPLQQGSDTRWLHPHIYDWPNEGSDADVANLPVLNWTAARASDVVVQVLHQWGEIVRQASHPNLYCNVRHLQIDQCRSSPGRARVEWIGEERDAASGTSRSGHAAQGLSAEFDHVVLAAGFGIEEGRPSYWRNENLGQPNLHQRHLTHLVSGQGDGAMIDLLRIRVSQFRQDRILEELFASRPGLLAELRRIKREHDDGKAGLFQSFEEVFGTAACAEEVAGLESLLESRLRRDTDAVLQIKVRDLAQLLEPQTSRTSFQNSLLIYLLYRVGGFAPSSESVGILSDRYGIATDQIVRRHGTKRDDHLKRMLAEPLYGAIKKRMKRNSKFCQQTTEMQWPGGYFGFPGRRDDMSTLTDDQLRSSWRKEYLPGPTRLVAATICGGIAGVVGTLRPNASHFRITLHRHLVLPGEQLLQQACDYVGRGVASGTPTAGRTFPAENAMIGLAFTQKTTVRTVPGVPEELLGDAMADLALHEAARSNPEARFILAIPLLIPAQSDRVSGVLYMDSRDDDFYLSDEETQQVLDVFQESVRQLAHFSRTPTVGIRNLHYVATGALPAHALRMTDAVRSAITLLPNGFAASVDEPFVLNFDYADPAAMPFPEPPTSTNA